MEKEEFKYSLKQYIAICFLSPFLVILILKYLSSSFHNHNYGDVAYFTVLLLITVGFTAGILYLTIWAKAIVLTNESIFIHASGYSIDWTDIKHIGRYTDDAMNFPSEYIEIYVRDQKKYIDMIRNPLVRFFKWKTRNMNNSPFYINLSTVKGDNDEIFHAVLRFYQNNRGF